ncbi:Fanconi anemia group A [Nymphon striatum]|nr:Fanconi anemia group A [Nymphon striatum]
MDNLKKEILSLIHENENFDHLLKELNELNESYSEVNLCADMLWHKSLKDSSEVVHQSFVASQVASQVHKICRLHTYSDSSTNQRQTLCATQISEVNKLVEIIQELIKDNRCDVSVFAKSISHGVLLPLELLQILHKSTLCDYEQYIMLNVINPEIIQEFTKSLIYYSLNMCNQVIDAFTEHIESILSPKVGIQLRSDIYYELIMQNGLVKPPVFITYISKSLTFILTYHPSIKDLITIYIKEGIEGCCSEKLITGLLLARQACSEGTHVFPTYSDWFQSHFGSADCILSSRKNFLFFMKLLNDLFPYEIMRFLKDHVSHPPHVPSSCHSVWQDYVKLVKNRIGESAEDKVGSTSDNKEEHAKKAQSVITEALSAFEKTEKIPLSIMEMSIFRKPFFIGIFLPFLLTPRPLPDVPDVKMKFINQLNSSGKIPKTMFDKYQNGCEREREQIFKDIWDDDVEMMEDDLFDPYEILCATCQNYVDKFQNKELDKINVILSQLSENLDQFLEEKHGKNQSHVSLSKKISSKADKALKTIMKTYRDLEGVTEYSYPLVSMLLSNLMLLPELCTYLYNHINVSDDLELDPSQFASFLYDIASQSSSIPLVLNKEEKPICILDLIFDEMDTSEEVTSRKTLLICSGYLDCCHKYKKDIYLPQNLHKKIQYLAPRFCGMLRKYFSANNSHPTLLKIVETYRLYERNLTKQNMKLSLSVTSEDNNEQLPWVLEQFLSLDSDNDNGKVSCLLHQIYQLPPYLIFFNIPNISRPLSQPVITAVIQLFNQKFKNTVCIIGEEYSWLPPRLILHTIKALAQVNDRTLNDRFMKDIPIMEASMIYHWKDINCSIPVAFQKENIITQINNLYQFVGRLFETTTGLELSRNLESWQLILAIHCMLKKDISNYGTLRNLMNNRTDSSDDETLHLSNLLKNYFNRKNSVQQLVKTINSIAVGSDNSVFSLLFPTSLIALLPYVTLMFVVDNYWKLGDNTSSLTLLLQIHTLCSKLKWNAKHHILITYDNKVSHILQNCALQSINCLLQDALSNCQEDLLNIIKQRTNSSKFM